MYNNYHIYVNNTRGIESYKVSEMYLHRFWLKDIGYQLLLQKDTVIWILFNTQCYICELQFLNVSCFHYNHYVKTGWVHFHDKAWQFPLKWFRISITRYSGDWLFIYSSLWLYHIAADTMWLKHSIWNFCAELTIWHEGVVEDTGRWYFANAYLKLIETECGTCE